MADTPTAGTVGMGIIKDAGKGAAIGANPLLMAATGGLSVALGAGTGALIGAFEGGSQLLKAHKAQREASNLLPSLSDPNQLAMLAELQQKRKSINTGSAITNAMGQIGKITSGTQQAIVQAGGGDSAGTIAALLSAQENAGDATNQAMAQAEGQQQFYTSAAMDLQKRVEGRSLELQMHARNQKLAEWAQGQQDATANLTNAAARTNPEAIDWMDILKRHGGNNTIYANDTQDFANANTEGISIPSNIPEVGGDISALTQVLG